MPLTFDLAQTVAAGPFNPYIITPEWLFREKVCDESERTDFFSGMLAEGTAFTTGPLEWEVDYRQLAVSASSDADCGKAVAGVLNLLHHTPVEAVGHNFHFSCEVAELPAAARPQLGPKDIGAFSNAAQFRWVGVFRGEAVTTEVTLALVPEEGVVILFNHDRRTSKADRNQEAIVAAKKFRDDLRKSVALLKDLFNLELSDA